MTDFYGVCCDDRVAVGLDCTLWFPIFGLTVYQRFVDHTVYAILPRFFDAVA